MVFSETQNVVLAAVAVAIAVLLSSAQLLAQTPPDKPAKPTGLSADPSHNSITLSWDDPQDSTIAGYRILRRESRIHAKGDFQTHVDDTGTAGTSYVDTSVSSETPYVYRIQARNSAGLSSRSKFVSVKTLEQPEDHVVGAEDLPADSDSVRAGAIDLGDISGLMNDPEYETGRLNGGDDRTDYIPL